MGRLLTGFFLSLVLIWGLGALLLTSPTVCHWDDALGIPTPVSGTIKQVRHENWNKFMYGALGLETSDAHRAITSEPKILIFGDSYIEADMVRPTERVQACLSKMGVPSVGIGISGCSCVEYYHLMNNYNKLIPNVTANVLVIADITDILPKNKTEVFLSVKPSFPFRKDEGRIGEYSYNFRLMAFRNMIKKAKKVSHKGLDFMGNHWSRYKARSSHEKISETFHYEKYWRSMISALQSQAPEGRLLIVYVPNIPSIHDNSISTIDNNEELIHRFATVCNEYSLVGGGILDVGPKLCDYTCRTKCFPHGFFNTCPGSGHLNGEGHRIMAEAIYEVLVP